MNNRYTFLSFPYVCHCDNGGRASKVPKGADRLCYPSTNLLQAFLLLKLRNVCFSVALIYKTSFIQNAENSRGRKHRHVPTVYVARVSARLEYGI